MKTVQFLLLIFTILIYISVANSDEKDSAVSVASEEDSNESVDSPSTESANDDDEDDEDDESASLESNNDDDDEEDEDDDDSTSDSSGTSSEDEDGDEDSSDSASSGEDDDSSTSDDSTSDDSTSSDSTSGDSPSSDSSSTYQPVGTEHTNDDSTSSATGYSVGCSDDIENDPCSCFTTGDDCDRDDCSWNSESEMCSDNSDEAILNNSGSNETLSTKSAPNTTTIAIGAIVGIAGFILVVLCGIFGHRLFCKNKNIAAEHEGAEKVAVVDDDDDLDIEGGTVPTMVMTSPRTQGDDGEQLMGNGRSNTDDDDDVLHLIRGDTNDGAVNMLIGNMDDDMDGDQRLGHTGY